MSVNQEAEVKKQTNSRKRTGWSLIWKSQLLTTECRSIS